MRADAAENRSTILSSAWHLFATQGPDVSLRAIASDAGVGIGTLYRHFDGKEALVMAIIGDLRKRTNGIVAAHRTGWDTAEQAAETWASFTSALGELKIGEIGPQLIPNAITPATSEVTIEEHMNFLNTDVAEILNHAKRWKLMREDITPLQFHLGLSSSTRPLPALAQELSPGIQEFLLDTYIAGLRP